LTNDNAAHVYCTGYREAIKSAVEATGGSGGATGTTVEVGRKGSGDDKLFAGLSNNDDDEEEEEPEDHLAWVPKKIVSERTSEDVDTESHITSALARQASVAVDLNCHTVLAY
jgi:hypothetical protein